MQKQETMNDNLANGMRAVNETLIEFGGGLLSMAFKKAKCYPLAKASMPTIITTIDSACNTYIIKMKYPKFLIHKGVDLLKPTIIKYRGGVDESHKGYAGWHAVGNKVLPTLTTQFVSFVKLMTMKEKICLGWNGGHKGVKKTWYPVAVANCQTVHRQSQNIIAEKRELELSIRKLTEREVFRFMDVDEEDIDKIFAAVPAKSQRYALAGNSIVVGVLYNIFEKMFVQTKPDPNTQLELNFDD